VETTTDTRSRSLQQSAGTWWFFLVTGALWLLVAVTVLRFDLTSVASVGVLLGSVLLLAGVNEFMTMSMRGAGWTWLHAAMGALFVLGGIWAFVHPIGAFYELASVLGFVLVLKGGMDIAIAAATKDLNDLWWLGLIVGLLEVLLAFWFSQQMFTPRAILIITWVGFAALFRGVGEIVLAFELRRVRPSSSA
jgi:uncharacterized membrane protein HdeD (DUF308 family)